MVYDSDFSRRQYLDSCAQSGNFYSSPDFIAQRYPSAICPPSSPLTNSRAERTTRFLAGLASKCPSSPFSLGSQVDRPSGQLPLQRSTHATSEDAMNSKTFLQGRLRSLSPHQGKRCCGCCQNFGNSRSSVGALSRFDQSTNPIGLNILDTQNGMESYLRRRNPLARHDDDAATGTSSSDLMKNKSIYSVRNIPVRSLDEVREAVAIRRNYVKERQKFLNGVTGESDGNLSVSASYRSRPSSVSPQPDGSIVTYPSLEKSENTVRVNEKNAGGYYEVVDNDEGET